MFCQYRVPVLAEQALGGDILSFIVKRCLILIPLLFLISIVTFIVIQLPPGDILTQSIGSQMMSNSEVAKETIARLAGQYGLVQPLYSRGLRTLWVQNDRAKSTLNQLYC